MEAGEGAGNLGETLDRRLEEPGGLRSGTAEGAGNRRSRKSRVPEEAGKELSLGDLRGPEESGIECEENSRKETTEPLEEGLRTQETRQGDPTYQDTRTEEDIHQLMDPESESGGRSPD